jgi:hypothetical protein
MLGRRGGLMLFVINNYRHVAPTGRRGGLMLFVINNYRHVAPTGQNIYNKIATLTVISPQRGDGAG